jgi:hypothetical protein
VVEDVAISLAIVASDQSEVRENRRLRTRSA